MDERKYMVMYFLKFSSWSNERKKDLEINRSTKRFIYNLELFI